MSFDRVMHYFREIASIPHGSGNTKEISSYCEAFAREKGLECIRDASGNVIIKKPGKGKNVMLQGHIDMVCECEPGASYDFEKNGIKIVEENGVLSAEGTTLGADDGAAVAIMLAILEDDDELPPLEAVFTVDEETGLLGARALDMSVLKAQTLINIDSEEEGIITAGCAGGIIKTVEIPVARKAAKGFVYQLTVAGLMGGHSGVEIDKNRANANKLLAKLLRAVSKKVQFKLVYAEGGNKDNAIPRMANALILTNEESQALIESVCEKCRKLFESEYKESENTVSVECLALGEGEEDVFDGNDIIAFLCSAPNGVIEYNGDKSKVIVSLNIGIMRSEAQKQVVCFSIRSNREGGCQELCERIERDASQYKASFFEDGEYPCWEFREKSPLREAVAEEYKKQTGKDAVVDIIHAGLECGVFAKSIKNLDAVSIGPDIKDIHTPKERMDIVSFERTYDLVKNVLKRL